MISIRTLFSSLALLAILAPGLARAEIQFIPTPQSERGKKLLTTTPPPSKPPAVTETPQAGERVQGQDGTLSAKFSETKICSWRGCVSYVYDTRTGNLAAVGGHWNKHYRQTSNGAEVVRADSFAADEQPKTVDRTDTKGKAGDAVNFEVKTPAPGFNPIDAAKASAPQ